MTLNMGKFARPLPPRGSAVQLDTDAIYSVFLSSELSTQELTH